MTADRRRRAVRRRVRWHIARNLGGLMILFGVGCLAAAEYIGWRS